MPGRRQILALLVLSAVVGVAVSVVAWGFLELIHAIQTGVFTDLPKDLGYHHGAPTWWPLPVLFVAGVVAAFAIVVLPGEGGHNPAEGLKTGVTRPIELPGVILAALATIGLGVVLGPEAPLIAVGSGLGILAIRTLRSDAPDPVVAVVASSGSFAAISFLFGSPVIGAVILLEAAGLDRRRLQVIMPTGLLAAGIGSLVSTGMGSWTGLSNKDYALTPLTLPSFARPDIAEFGWTIPLAVAIAVGGVAVFVGARAVQRVLVTRLLLLLPLAGLVIAGLAIAYAEWAGKSTSDVLFDGQSGLSALVDRPAAWSVSALLLLLLFKSLAWSVSLAGFRGGPTFPAVYLGAAAGLLASHLPGMPLTPAVAVGIGCGVVTALRLPLSAVVLASLLTGAGSGAAALMIVGVVVSYITALALDRRLAGAAGAPAAGEPAGEQRFERAPAASRG